MLQADAEVLLSVRPVQEHARHIPDQTRSISDQVHGHVSRQHSKSSVSAHKVSKFRVDPKSARIQDFFQGTRTFVVGMTCQTVLDAHAVGCRPVDNNAGILSHCSEDNVAHCLQKENCAQFGAILLGKCEFRRRVTKPGEKGCSQNCPKILKTQEKVSPV